jgi:hypothetical protein
MIRRHAVVRHALLLVALGPALANAYPIPPVPLRKLVETSDLIVLAHVIGVSSPESAEADPTRLRWDTDVAHLDVLETLKGSSPPLLEVRFTASMMCPAPPRYEPGETVLAFLRSGDHMAAEVRAEDCSADVCAELESMSGNWYTNSLSYGTLYPTSEEMDVYRGAIRDASRLDSTDPKAVRAWQLRAAERRATRWHGLYELASSSDPVHAFYDRRKKTSAPLTREEKDRLADGFVKEPSLDPTLPMTLSILSDVPRADLDATALAAVEALLAREEPPYHAKETIELVAVRFGAPARAESAEHSDSAPRSEAPSGGAGDRDCTGSDDVPDLEAEIAGVEATLRSDPLIAWHEDDYRPEALRARWSGLKAALKIPDAAPLAEPETRRFGVGGLTPP